MSQPDVPIPNRRSLLVAAGAALTVSAFPAAALATPAILRGGLDPASFGVSGRATGDQTRQLQALIDAATAAQEPVVLPAGVYHAAGLRLTARACLLGSNGATRFILAQAGSILTARQAELIEICGISFDAGGHQLGAEARGLLDLRGIERLGLEDCIISGGGGEGVFLQNTAGRIHGCRIEGARDAGIFSLNATGLEIAGNTITDCGNGGILVHRSEKGEDDTIITGNRIERIRADNGGTGQFGNGINAFRAGGVIVARNIVSDCAFSAIRANAADLLQVDGNRCMRSGETALYAEFGFEGAVITSNIIDGAANGLSIVNFNEGGRLAVCQGNLVRNLSERGPYRADPPGFGVGITVEADTAVTGNVIENAPRYGIHIGWGSFMRNVVATGNVVRNAAEGIAVSVVEGTGSAVITDNVIDGASRGAVVGHRWTEAVTGDLAGEGSEAFPNLIVARNRVS